MEDPIDFEEDFDNSGAYFSLAEISIEHINWDYVYLITVETIKYPGKTKYMVAQIDLLEKELRPFTNYIGSLCNAIWKTGPINKVKYTFYNWNREDLTDASRESTQVLLQDDGSVPWITVNEEFDLTDLEELF